MKFISTKKYAQLTDEPTPLTSSFINSLLPPASGMPRDAARYKGYYIVVTEDHEPDAGAYKYYAISEDGSDVKSMPYITYSDKGLDFIRQWIDNGFQTPERKQTL